MTWVDPKLNQDTFLHGTLSGNGWTHLLRRLHLDTAYALGKG
jgi:hypothetical protein